MKAVNLLWAILALVVAVRLLIVGRAQRSLWYYAAWVGLLAVAEAAAAVVGLPAMPLFLLLPATFIALQSGVGTGDRPLPDRFASTLAYALLIAGLAVVTSEFLFITNDVEELVAPGRRGRSEIVLSVFRLCYIVHFTLSLAISGQSLEASRRSYASEYSNGMAGRWSAGDRVMMALGAGLCVLFLIFGESEAERLSETLSIVAIPGMLLTVTALSVMARRSLQLRGMTTTRYPTVPETSAQGGLDKGQTEEIKRRLDEAMSTKELYRDPSLSLGGLAEDLGVNTSYLSRVINTAYGVNFCEYVNELRIRSFIDSGSAILDGRENILTVAMESGFNAKSTFNAVFKRHTGMTPRQYLLTERDE